MLAHVRRGNVPTRNLNDLFPYSIWLLHLISALDKSHLRVVVLARFLIWRGEIRIRLGAREHARLARDRYSFVVSLVVIRGNYPLGKHGGLEASRPLRRIFRPFHAFKIYLTRAAL